MPQEFAKKTITAEVTPGVTTVVAQEGQPIDAAYRDLVPDDAVTTTDPRDHANIEYSPTQRQSYGEAATGGEKARTGARNKARKRAESKSDDGEES